MPVFISHRTADDPIARLVSDRLTGVHGIKCYIDDLDRETTTKNITALIVSRLKQCANLLVLVSKNTQGSWWEPFEVGVAREAPRIITSYTNLQQEELPEFLTEWPVLRGTNAIDKFAALYKVKIETAKRAFSESRTAAAVASSSAEVDAFHKQLKASLGQ